MQAPPLYEAAEEDFLGGGRGLFSNLKMMLVRWEQRVGGGVGGLADTAQQVATICRENIQLKSCFACFSKSIKHPQATAAQPIIVAG